MEPFVYVVNRAIMRTGEDRQVRIGEGDVVCKGCEGDLWFQVLFRFWAGVKDGARLRQDCYWGVNCTTMRHNY